MTKQEGLENLTFLVQVGSFWNEIGPETGKETYKIFVIIFYMALHLEGEYCQVILLLCMFSFLRGFPRRAGVSKGLMGIT